MHIIYFYFYAWVFVFPGLVYYNKLSCFCIFITSSPTENQTYGIFWINLHSDHLQTGGWWQRNSQVTRWKQYWHYLPFLPGSRFSQHSWFTVTKKKEYFISSSPAQKLYFVQYVNEIYTKYWRNEKEIKGNAFSGLRNVLSFNKFNRNPVCSLILI